MTRTIVIGRKLNYQRETKDKGLAALVRKFKLTAKSFRLLVNWLGDGAKIENIDRVSRRAETCAKCPYLIKDKSYWGIIKKQEAERIKKLIKLEKNINKGEINTDICKGFCYWCGCYMPLKVYIKLKKYDKSYPEHCWMNHED